MTNNSLKWIVLRDSSPFEARQGRSLSLNKDRSLQRHQRLLKGRDARRADGRRRRASRLTPPRQEPQSGRPPVCTVDPAPQA